MTRSHSTIPKLASLDEVTWLKLREFQNDGSLVVVEGVRDVPFAIARIFYIYGVTPGAQRGDHAHVNCKQILACLNGSCEVTCDDGLGKKTFALTSPSRALYIPPGIWSAERFIAPSSVLLVFSDLVYDESDYIRDYGQFEKFRHGQP